MADDKPTDEQTPEPEQEQAPPAEQEAAAEEAAAEQVPDQQDDAAVEEPAAAETDEPAAAEADEPAAAETDEPAAAEAESDEGEAAPRAKPAIPGADLDVDIVLEGSDPLSRGEGEDGADAVGTADEEADVDDKPITTTIDLAASARYRATGKRKTAIARVTLKPGTGAYTVNGKTMDEFFPRPTLQRNIRQPLEAVGYEDRMDVVALMTGGGVSSQAGALRHGISRALLDADPNLRGELKRRGFLTRDARAKERKKAGLKKARKRPQFSKR